MATSLLLRMAPDAESQEGRKRFPGLLLGALVTMVLLGAAAIVWLGPWRRGAERVTRASITLPADQAPAPGLNAHPVVAISPDGERIVYTAGSTGSYQLFLRRMDQFEATPIPGTRGGHGPFFSPDGRSVAYFQEGALKRVSLESSEVITIASAAGGFGGTWLEDGTIVFAPEATGGLVRVQAAGGTPTPLPRPTSGCGYRWPSAAADGDTIIATRWPSSVLTAAVVAISIKGGTERVIAERATFGRYVPTGHVVFLRQGELHATPFAPGSGSGQLKTVLPDVMTGATGAGQFGFSPAGTLLYLPDTPERTRRLLAIVDRQGRSTDLPIPGRPFQNISTCGERFAVTISERGASDIWTGRVDRTTLSRLTSDGLNIEPVWTPDCQTLTFSSSQTGVMNIYGKPADGSGEAQRIVEGPQTLAAGSWTPDGRRLLHWQLGGETRADIWILDRDSGRRRPLVSTRATESVPRVSPDGRRFAYQSDESGRAEIYLGSLEGAGRIQVSSEGGTWPSWSADGRELYYLQSRSIMRVGDARSARGRSERSAAGVHRPRSRHVPSDADRLSHRPPDRRTPATNEVEPGRELVRGAAAPDPLVRLTLSDAASPGRMFTVVSYGSRPSLRISIRCGPSESSITRRSREPENSQRSPSTNTSASDGCTRIESVPKRLDLSSSRSRGGYRDIRSSRSRGDAGAGAGAGRGGAASPAPSGSIAR